MSQGRDQISAMLQKEFHWFPFLLDYGLDGLLGSCTDAVHGHGVSRRMV